MKFGITITLISLSLIAGAQNWKPLFNGNNLEGWNKKGGEAIYALEGDVIVGTAKGRWNTFLCTEKEYGNFILELELFVDPQMNSGIQIRSHEADRVYGYQVEVDPAERAWSGGLYDESRRGWLYPLSLNPEARGAFKNGLWNKYRIEANGPSIRVWVNGICTSLTLDDKDATGFIGLQVHGIGQNAPEGMQIKWRNVRIMTENIEDYLTPVPDSLYELNLLSNELTDREQSQRWKMLWDGVSPKGWRQIHTNSFPNGRWIIENGELTVKSSSGDQTSDSKDIITENKFGNFELTLQYKITEGANSGIKYFVDESLNPTGGAIGLEFQILDNKNHPDAKNGINGNRTQGALYDLIAPENLSWQSTGPQYIKPIGQWNHVRIISNGGQVEHWLNGFKIVEYDRFSEKFQAQVFNSKYKEWANFGRVEKGHIVLQDHGDRVSFRSIKIREIQR